MNNPGPRPKTLELNVENKKHGLPRIEKLRKAKPKLGFLSIEPLLEDLGKVNLSHIGWVIVGGESGHGARPMNKEWVINLRDQCKAAGVPFFFKQWGGVRKRVTGRKLEGKFYDEFPGSGGGRGLGQIQSGAPIGVWG